MSPENDIIPTTRACSTCRVVPRPKGGPQVQRSAFQSGPGRCGRCDPADPLRGRRAAMAAAAALATAVSTLLYLAVLGRSSRTSRSPAAVIGRWIGCPCGPSDRAICCYYRRRCRWIVGCACFTGRRSPVTQPAPPPVAIVHSSHRCVRVAFPHNMHPKQCMMHHVLGIVGLSGVCGQGRHTSVLHNRPDRDTGNCLCQPPATWPLVPS